MIGNYAFSGCNIWGNVDNSEFSGEIGYRAFIENGRITSVRWERNVASIGDYAFQNCSNLSAIGWNTKLSYIGVAAFEILQLLN